MNTFSDWKDGFIHAGCTAIVTLWIAYNDPPLGIAAIFFSLIVFFWFWRELDQQVTKNKPWQPWRWSLQKWWEFGATIPAAALVFL